MASSYNQVLNRDHKEFLSPVMLSVPSFEKPMHFSLSILFFSRSFFFFSRPQCLNCCFNNYYKSPKICFYFSIILIIKSYTNKLQSLGTSVDSSTSKQRYLAVSIFDNNSSSRAGEIISVISLEHFVRCSFRFLRVLPSPLHSQFHLSGLQQQLGSEFNSYSKLQFSSFQSIRIL